MQVTVEDAERYLSSRGATLWGRSFNVHNDAGRRRAAEWLVATISELSTQTADR